MSLRSPFLNGENTRQSPFRRQNSTGPATMRPSTPNSSPTKSPLKSTSLSPEKTSPFVRRPSQNSQATAVSSSPVGRPSSRLSVLPDSPSPNVNKAGLRSPVVGSSTPASPAKGTSPLTLEDGKKNSQPQAEVTDYSNSPIAVKYLDPATELPNPFQTSLRPAARRTVTSSTASTIKQPSPFESQSARTPAKGTGGPRFIGGGSGGYNHIPAALLRSMRESFEVLDSSNMGSVDSAAVSNMLEQMGMSNSTSSLREFFPPSLPDNLNLARYLDILSGPFAELSRPEELEAAFAAFDVDDSGQIDVSELRDALLRTAPEPGEEDYRICESEIDEILSGYVGRRAFGAKGVNAAKGKSDVFRYRDFMASMNGAAAVEPAEQRDATLVA